MWRPESIASISVKRSLLFLAPLLFLFAGKPQGAVAQVVLDAEPDCTSIVGRMICGSDALRAAYRNASSILQAQSQFYFGDTLANRMFVQEKLAEWQRNWSENCRMEEDASGAKRSCLLDSIWAASVSARCPLVVSLFGTPGPDRQRAWLKQNEPFCRDEIEYLYQSDG